MKHIMADDELFQNEMEGVEPLKQNKKTVLPRSAIDHTHKAVLRKHAEHEKKADVNFLDLENIEMVDPGDIIGNKKPGVQNGVYKKLRQGKYPSENHLDLHKTTVKQAQKQVLNFIDDSRKKNYRCVIITHGKGVYSKTPGKIKSHVNHWLQQIPEVLAFHSTLAKDGGSGAVYLLLKKTEVKKQENRDTYNR